MHEVTSPPPPLPFPLPLLPPPSPLPFPLPSLPPPSPPGEVVYRFWLEKDFSSRMHSIMA